MGELFDAPDALECYRRTRSIIPQQALALTNSDLIHQLSAALADAEQETNPERFVVAVFERILSRTPTTNEIEACSQFLSKQAELESSANARARESLVRALFNHNDFVTIR